MGRPRIHPDRRRSWDERSGNEQTEARKAAKAKWARQNRLKKKYKDNMEYTSNGLAYGRYGEGVVIDGYVLTVADLEQRIKAYKELVSIIRPTTAKRTPPEVA
jgi:hypothetical protein